MRRRHSDEAAARRGGPGCGCSMLILLVLVGGVLVWGGSHGGSAPPIVTGQPAAPAVTQPAVQARRERRWGPGVLGGTLADWIHAYGRPMAISPPSVYDWRPCPNGRYGAIMVTFSGGRAIALVAQPCTNGSVVPMALRRAFAKQYMPADSVARGRVAATDEAGAPITDLLYTSRLLAHMLPRDQFQDCNQNPVSPGLFTVNVHQASDTGMQMGPGTCA